MRAVSERSAMPAVPPHLAQMFLALVAAVAALFVSAQSRLAGSTNAERLRGTLAGALVVTVWLALPGVLAARGVLGDFSRMPPPFMLMMLALLAATVALAFSPLGTRLVEHAPVHALIGYQVFRVPLEFWLHAMHEQGAIPEQMTWSGLNFDVVAGITALAVASMAWRGQASRRWIAGWNWLGFALLLNIAWIAVTSLPTPLRIFTSEPALTLPATFPYVWLPAFLVQSALFGHVLVWRWLARNH
jgi:hypothetical protein